MKRFAALILLLLYFATSTGATINFHFCMGEVESISMLGNAKKKCGKCGMENKPSIDIGCCKDEGKWIKIKDDQKPNAIHFESPGLQFKATRIDIFSTSFFASPVLPSISESRTLLRGCEAETYLLNCVFRI